MTQEDKELLLKDLCARLPYKPRVKYGYSFIGVAAISGYTDEGYLNYDELKDFSIFPKCGLERKRVSNIIPYLRPMSSMTEDERDEVKEICANYLDEWENTETVVDRWKLDAKTSYLRSEFYNSHHLDWNGLIEKGLALEAKEETYNIKTE